MARLASVERRLTRLPVAWAKLVGLKCVEHSQVPRNIASNTQIVNGQPSKHTGRINQVHAAVRDPLAAVQHIIRLGQLMACITNHQMLQGPEFLMRITPALVRIHTIGAGCQDHSVAVAEFSECLVKSNKLGRTYKCEVQGIELQANPFPFQVRQFQVLKLIVPCHASSDHRPSMRLCHRRDIDTVRCDPQLARTND